MRPRILIAPLDWGLGHTTRCIPIIKIFLELGASITVAGNEKQAQLLCSEISSLQWIPLEGYNLSYSRSALTTRLKIFLQIPKILTAIKRENRRLKKLVSEQEFDLIISDNRFGFRQPDIYSVFITHQLQIQVPFSKWVEKKLQQWNYHFINQFDECWVPDYVEETNLAGELSHPSILPGTTTKYIGALSRFTNDAVDFPKEKFLLFIISGPEPQRTIFENKIEEQLTSFSGVAIVLRGLPGSNEKKKQFGQTIFINHLPSAEMNRLIQQASLVIARSGYSTIMDLARMQKKSILVPTPGQSEQEYLAAYLMKRKLFIAFDQKDFFLNKALEVAKDFQFAEMNVFNEVNLSTVVRELLDRIVIKSP